MKLIVSNVLAIVACVAAVPQNFGFLDQGRAIAGFGVGVGTVPAFGLGEGAIGLASGGPRGALINGARGARQGADIAELVGGQYHRQYSRSPYAGYYSGQEADIAQLVGGQYRRQYSQSPYAGYSSAF